MARDKVGGWATISTISTRKQTVETDDENEKEEEVGKFPQVVFLIRLD